MLKLGMGRKKGKYLPAPKSAKYNHNKKLNKDMKKALAGTIKKSNNIEKEVLMKNWIQTLILVLTFVSGGIALIFASGVQLNKINNGIEQNSKSLSELIEINKSSVKRVSILERKSDKTEIYVNLNRSEIKMLKK